jgi:hypothetical protein
LLMSIIYDFSCTLKIAQDIKFLLG